MCEWLPHKNTSQSFSPSNPKPTFKACKILNESRAGRRRLPGISFPKLQLQSVVDLIVSVCVSDMQNIFT